MKTRMRKETDFDLHRLTSPQHAIQPVKLEQRTLKSDEASKLPPTRSGDGERLSSSARVPVGLEVTPVFEKHYSVKELANLWNLSDRTIRRMFVGEPGVVEWGACERRKKRAYKTLRIPESVARRVHRRLRKVS